MQVHVPQNHIAFPAADDALIPRLPYGPGENIEVGLAVCPAGVDGGTSGPRGSASASLCRFSAGCCDAGATSGSFWAAAAAALHVAGRM